MVLQKLFGKTNHKIGNAKDVLDRVDKIFKIVVPTKIAHFEDILKTLLNQFQAILDVNCWRNYISVWKIFYLDHICKFQQ